MIQAALVTASRPSPIMAEVLIGAAAVLLLIGLWTPMAGGLIAVMEFVLARCHPEDP
jgi:hypothetical protein